MVFFIGTTFILLEPFFKRIELKLEAKGKWMEAQKLRKLQTRALGESRVNLEHLVSVVETEIRIQEIVQRETFLKEECQSLYDKLSTKDHFTEGDEQKLSRWLDELDALNKEYWRQERDEYTLVITRYSCYPSTRAYSSTRRRSGWHLNRLLRTDCAERGGCCGRVCGCCERPRSITRAFRFGHCTASCGCCQRSRGFEILRDEEDEDHQRSQTTVRHFRKFLTSRNVMLGAYIWGI